MNPQLAQAKHALAAIERNLAVNKQSIALLNEAMDANDPLEAMRLIAKSLAVSTEHQIKAGESDIASLREAIAIQESPIARAGLIPPGRM